MKCTHYKEELEFKELDTFIGANSKYYLKYISKLENKNMFSSWNWPCFFLGSYWLLYRKLYIPALILIGVNFASSKLFESKTYLAFIFITRILLTIFANNIYLKNCKRKIKIIRENMPDFNAYEYLKKLHQKGGVSLAGPATLLIISILAAMIYIIIWFSNMSGALHSYHGSYYL